MTSRDNTAALPGGTGGGTLTNGVHSHYSTEANASPLPPAPAQLLEAALEYARLGWPVFPLVPGAKNPRTPHGLNDATTDENAIREWWRRSPNANVGLACEGAGLFVVDVDTFGGKQGTKSLARLVIDLGFDPFADTLSQVTRSGGTQYLFRLPPGVAARSRASAGGYLHLDVRAHGGYIVVPPSCVDADEKGPAGIYSWVGGFDVARIQTAPERLLELLAAKPAKQAPLPVAGGSEAAPAGLSGSDPAELMERIFREAVSGVTFSSAGGNRNIRAHHLGQQLRDNGFTIVQAVGMAGRFAAACPGDGFPPAEAEQAIRSAFTQPPREPWAQPAPNRIKRPVPASDTNEAESLPDGCPAGAPGPDSLPWPFLAPEALHGPAGDFIRAVTPLIETDSASLLVQLLVGFGNAMGRGPHFTVGNTRHGGNEFAAVVGETGCGKGAGWGRVADVLRAVDPTWYSTRQYTSFPSGESIPWAVRDPQLKRKNIAPRDKPAKYEEVLGDGIDDKRLVIRYSELREVLVTMHRDANTISPTLRNAFDGELLMNAGKTNPCMVREHHISFVGHITPRELLTSIEPADLTNGLVSRFLWCVLRFERSLPNPPRLDDSVKNPLVAAFHAAMEHARIEREYERDEAAERLWEAIYPALRDRPKTLMGSITERARVHVLRLALIYAVLDRDTAIRVPHLLARLAVWQFCESSACRVFQPLIHESDPAVRIYGYLLGKLPDGATRTEISGDCFRRNMPGDLIAAALGTLEAMGAVAKVTEGSTPKGGRPTERYTARREDEKGYFVFSSGSDGLVDYVETAKRILAQQSVTTSERIDEFTPANMPSLDEALPSPDDEEDFSMNALLRSLRARGIAVRLNGDKVNVRPASLLTDADRNRIRANKSVIVAILAGTAVTVRSRLLGEDVRVVEALDGPAAVPVETGPATYCRAEVERMLGLDADEVRAIHTLKRHFGGEHLGLASSEDAASVEQMPPADHGTQCRADPSAKTAPTAEEVGEPEVLAQLAVESYPIGSRVWVRHRALSQGEPEWRQATVLRVWGAVDDPYLTPPELAGQVMVQVDGMEAETLLSVCQLFRDRKEIERCT